MHHWQSMYSATGNRMGNLARSCQLRE
jgi:hypothetical protein